MFNHVLVPTDGSEFSERVSARAIEFAKSIGARVTALHVGPEFEPIAYDGLLPFDPVTDEQFAQEARARGQKYLAATENAARAAGVPIQCDYRTGNHPWDAIIKAAQEHGCDLIVMGSHGRGALASLILGGETIRVLTHTEIPVLVLR